MLLGRQRRVAQSELVAVRIGKMREAAPAHLDRKLRGHHAQLTRIAIEIPSQGEKVELRMVSLWCPRNSRARPEQIEIMRKHLGNIHPDYAAAFERLIEQAREQRDE